MCTDDWNIFSFVSLPNRRVAKSEQFVLLNHEGVERVKFCTCFFTTDDMRENDSARQNCHRVGATDSCNSSTNRVEAE